VTVLKAGCRGWGVAYLPSGQPSWLAALSLTRRPRSQACQSTGERRKVDTAAALAAEHTLSFY